MKRHLERVVAVVLGIVGFGGSAGCGDNERLRVGPEAVIDRAPAMLSSNPRVEIQFHAVGEAVGFACSLDDAAPAECESPWTFDATDGEHRIAITATGAGGVAGAPARASFAVDTRPPDTVITVGPSAVVMAAAASFTFAASPPEAGATFECALDGAAFAACTSPVMTAALAEGDHAFRVRATDAAGNIDPTPAMQAWAIDMTGPPVALDQTPPDPSNTAAPTFRFSSTEASATFECQLDGVTTFAACTSPYAAPTLADGAQTFRVRATDAAQNQSTASYTWTVDTAAPTITITGGPTGATPDTTPTFTFSIAGAFTAARCRIDAAAFTACSGMFTPAPLADGPHVFEVQADDAAGNTGSATQAFTVDGTPMCNNGNVEAGEQCDGAQLGGATCSSLGFASGTLGCTGSCTFDTRECFAPANTGFLGKVCFDGVQFPAPGNGNYVAACTEDNGVFRSTLATAPVWSGLNGTGTATQVVNNLHGRGIFPQPDGPAVTLLADNSSTNNAFRSSNFGQAVPTTWTQFSFGSGGMQFELFSARPGTSTNNMIGGWHPVLGAAVLHGMLPPGTMTASAIGPMVTGTVRSIAAGAFSATTDVYAAVHGRNPAGDLALGGGIYWTCDQVGQLGGTYVARDTGIAAADKPLVWSLTVDPASFTAGTRTCPTTGGTVSGYANTYYATFRGGGQVYKTADGGETWATANTGLPAGAEVYKIALDCFSTASPITCPGCRCVDHNLLYAATSAGLYKSTNAGASWTLLGLAGNVVRGVTLQREHPMGTLPRIFVGVDDAAGIYQANPP